MTQPGVAFRAVLSWHFWRHDFAGDHLDVALAQGGLTLKGAERGFLHLPFARLSRMRIGFEETKHGRIYETWIWLEGEKRPFALNPNGSSEYAGYAATVRGLAAGFAKSGRSARVLTGVSVANAVLLPALIGILAVVAFVIATVALNEPEWWQFMAVPLVPTVVFAILAWQAVTRQWPRPMRALGDLDRHLP